eukprot:236857-Amphidinium_carterae.1
MTRSSASASTEGHIDRHATCGWAKGELYQLAAFSTSLKPGCGHPPQQVRGSGSCLWDRWRGPGEPVA